MPTSRSLLMLAALWLGITVSGCAAADQTNTTSCAATDIVLLPGSPPRGIAGSCNGTAGYASPGKAPVVTVHVGEVIQLTHFEVPLSTDAKIARVGRAASVNNYPVWTLTALAPGETTLFDRSRGSCMYGGTAPRCALVNFKVIL